jgi:lysophospholipase L1-like esterase
MRTKITTRLPLFLSCLFLALSVPFGSAQTATSQAPPQTTRFEIPVTDEGLPGSGPIRRYDWFRKLWRERRSAWAGEVQKDQKAVVFLGDSITQGWGDRLAAAFPGVKVANRGISGDTTRGMLIRLKEDVLALNPSAVVMLLGTNDLEEQAAPETIASNLRLIISALEKHNRKMPIVLCLVFPSSVSKHRPADQIRAINSLYMKAARTHPQITVLDTWSLFANAEGDAKIEEFPDLLHPNDAGYAKWAAALRPIFATLGFMENKPDQFTPEPGYESLFNGHDLSGWGYRPTSQADLEARKRWQATDPEAADWPIVTRSANFNGRKATPDGRFLARYGRLIVTIPPEGRRIQQLWTNREFPHDFVLKLEFRATPNADSGVFIRGVQLQCRDYVLAGPYRQLKRYKPQEWNEIVVTVTGQKASATCNGEVLETMDVPATGPIGLEGDRGQMEYRQIRIHESKARE